MQEQEQEPPLLVWGGEEALGGHTLRSDSGRKAAELAQSMATQHLCDDRGKRSGEQSVGKSMALASLDVLTWRLRSGDAASVLSGPLASVVREVSGGHPLSEFGRPAAAV